MQHTQPQHAYDVFIIGGGINGAGVAADAALRGLLAALRDEVFGNPLRTADELAEQEAREIRQQFLDRDVTWISRDQQWQTVRDIGHRIRVHRPARMGRVLIVHKVGIADDAYDGPRHSNVLAVALIGMDANGRLGNVQQNTPCMTAQRNVQLRTSVTM